MLHSVPDQLPEQPVTDNVVGVVQPEAAEGKMTHDQVNTPEATPLEGLFEVWAWRAFTIISPKARHCAVLKVNSSHRLLPRTIITGQ